MGRVTVTNAHVFMSTYETQKQPVSDSVRGLADPDKACHKCGKPARRLRNCEHCGWNVWLCQECYYGKDHYEDYCKSYREDFQWYS